MILFPKGLLLFFALLSFGIIFSGCNAQQMMVNDEINYSHKEYNDNQQLIVEGESFENGVKNGRWRYYNSEGRMVRVQHFKDNVINGMVSQELNNPGIPRKIEGLMMDGKKIGMWIGYKSIKKNNWLKTHYTIFNQNSQEIARVTFHPNGAVSYETFYDTEGQPRWFKKYDKKGRLIEEGDDFTFKAF